MFKSQMLIAVLCILALSSVVRGKFSLNFGVVWPGSLAWYFGLVLARCPQEFESGVTIRRNITSNLGKAADLVKLLAGINFCTCVYMDTNICKLPAVGIFNFIITFP